ncbi:MAG: hypothetical protein RIB79_00230 [Allomuricauda sp.]|jgi:hypothetical protein
MKATVRMALMTLLTGLCTLHAQKLPKKTSIDISQTPKIDLSTKIIAKPQRIEVKKFEGLNAEQIAKLPATTYDRSALLKLKFNKSWEIGPGQMSDKDMKVVSYFGKYEQSPRFISVHPENKYYSRLNNGAPGFLPEMRYLVLQFNPEAGQRYRVIIKLKPGEYGNKKVMTNVTGKYNETWFINNQYDEIMFDFIGDSREIKISPIIAGSESYYSKYEPLDIAKIKVDRIDE